MLALDNLNTDPGAPIDVVVVIFADDGDVVLLLGEVAICAITLCCEISGAAKRENITTAVAAANAIDDFNVRDFLFVLFEEVINLITMCMY
jgi:hypothetical protein